MLTWVFHHQVTTYTVYDPWIAMIEAKFALQLRLRVDNLGNLNISWFFDRLFWLIAERIERLLLVEIILDCFLLWVTCDFPNQLRMLMVSERFTVSSGMPETLKSICASFVGKIELIHGLTMFAIFLSLHYVLCFFAFGLPRAIVSLHVLSLLGYGLPRAIGRNLVLLATHQQQQHLELRVAPCYLD